MHLFGRQLRIRSRTTPLESDPETKTTALRTGMALSAEVESTAVSQGEYLQVVAISYRIAMPEDSI